MSTKNTKRVYVIGFCPANHDSMDNDGDLMGQIFTLRDYIRKNNMHVFGYFYPCYTRPTLEKSLKEAYRYCVKNPHITLLLANHIERIAPLIKDFPEWKKKFDSIGVKIRNISNDKLSSYRFMDMMTEHLNSSQINRSEQVRKRMKNKAKQGYWLFRTPVGYTTTKNSGVLELNDFGNKLKIAIDSVCNSELAPEEISLVLETIFEDNFNKHWSIAKISELLLNPFYIGFVKYGKNYYPGKHEPLLSEEQLEKIKEVSGFAI